MCTTRLSSLAGELLAGLGSVGSSKLSMIMMTRPSSFFTGTTSISQLKHTPAGTEWHREQKNGGELLSFQVIPNIATRCWHQTENDYCATQRTLFIHSLSFFTILKQFIFQCEDSSSTSFVHYLHLSILLKVICSNQWTNSPNESLSLNQFHIFQTQGSVNSIISIMLQKRLHSVGSTVVPL